MAKKGETALEKEKRQKKEVHEATDYLKQVDAPAGMGGGKEFVIKEIEEERRREKGEKDRAKNATVGKKGHGYKRILADYLQKELEKLDWPKKWEYVALPTSDEQRIKIYGKFYTARNGIISIIKDAGGEVWFLAVGVDGDANTDIKCMNKMVVYAEDVIDKAKGLLYDGGGSKKTKSGIYLP